MKTVHVAVAALLAAGLAAQAQAKDALTKEQFIDYSAQMKCAEQQWSYADPERYEKEQQKIDKAFGLKEKDIEAGVIDDLAAKYNADNAVLDAVDAKAAALCPAPVEPPAE